MLRSLYAQRQPVRLPFTISTLRVDPKTFRYATGLAALLRGQALEDRTPTIDLSGGGPGTALILNYRAPFYPWLFHMFGDTGHFVDAAWTLMPPRRCAAAWIVGPTHPAFSQTAAARELASRKADYRLIGQFLGVSWGKVKEIAILRSATL